MKINLVPLFETLLDVKLKNASKMKDDQFFELLQYDPILYTINDFSDENLINQQESYSRWLLKMYNNKQLVGKTPESVKKLLKNFNEIKKRKNNLPSNDINGYKSIDELQSAIKTALESMTANQKSKQAKRDEKTLKGSDKKELGMYMDGATELIYNGKEWEVWIPHTYEGSKALGRGAGWCTASGASDSYFGRYKNDGELYIILNKQDDNNKWQLFVDDNGNTSEFKDDKNTVNYRFRAFVHENPELLEFFKDVDQVTNRFENLDDEDYEDYDDEDGDELLAEEASEAGFFDFYHESNMRESIGECIIYKVYSAEIGTDYVSEKDILSTLEYEEPEIGDGDKIDDLIEDIIRSDGFKDDCDWESSVLDDLWEEAVEQLKEDGIEHELSFDLFLKLLFDSKSLGDEDEEIVKIFQDFFARYVSAEDDSYPFYDKTVYSIIHNYKYSLLEEVRNELWELLGSREWIYTNNSLFAVVDDSGMNISEWWREHRHDNVNWDNENEVLEHFNIDTRMGLSSSFDGDTMDFEYFRESDKDYIAKEIYKQLFDFSQYNDENVENEGYEGFLNKGDKVTQEKFLYYTPNFKAHNKIFEILMEQGFIDIDHSKNESIISILSNDIGNWLKENKEDLINQYDEFDEDFFKTLFQLFAIRKNSLDESINKEIQNIINLGKLKR